MKMPPPEPVLQRQAFELPADAPDSFAKFQALVGPMFELTRLQEGEPFHARAWVTFMPDVLLSRAENAGVRFLRSRRAIARSGLDDILVMVYLTRRFTCEVDGRTFTVQPREIAFFDLARPFAIRSDEVDNISLHVSRRRLAELMPAMTGIHGFVLRDGATRDLLLAHLLACADAAARITTAESQAVSAATLQLVAAGLQSAKRQAARQAPRVGLAAIGEVKDFIEAHLGRPDLGPDVLADTFSLSRATLYRMFEPVGGVAAFILDRRLNRALQAITAPHAPQLRLKQLAHELGFAHPTSFTRAFKKRFGMPPDEVRALRAYPDEVQSAAWRQTMITNRPLVEIMSAPGTVEAA